VRQYLDVEIISYLTSKGLSNSFFLMTPLAFPMAIGDSKFLLLAGVVPGKRKMWRFAALSFYDGQPEFNPNSE